MFRAIALLSVAGLAASTPTPPSASRSGLSPSDFVLAPLYTPPGPGSGSPLAGINPLNTDSHIISDSYIVVLDDHLEQHHIDAHHAVVDSVHSADLHKRSRKISASTAFSGIVHKFDVGPKSKKAGKKLRGYSGKFSENTLDAIRSMKGVKYVERDSIVHTQAVEKGAPWGLSRISHHETLTFGTFQRYDYNETAGEGVDAYIIDTGININHVEFEGRAKWGKTIPADGDTDNNGHGTHVAGTVGSRKYGVAKKATLYAVKVLGAGGSGTMSDVVAGVAWAADAASASRDAALAGKKKGHKGSVANMSLGGGKSQALDDAVDAAVEDGLHFAVAAGNDNKDACNYSPASALNAVSVVASTIGDERAYFSNWGTCTDIAAPGLNIMSTWNTGNSSTNKISGTSMASPHVCGLMAYFLSLYPDEPSSAAASSNAFTEVYNLASGSGSVKQFIFGKVSKWSGFVAPTPKQPATMTPKMMKKLLLKLATKGVLTDLPAGTQNLLINNAYGDKKLMETIRELQLEA